MKSIAAFATVMITFSLNASAVEIPNSTTNASAQNLSHGEIGSSSFHRADKSFQALATLFGSGPTAVGSSGLSLGFHLDPDSIVLVEMTSGRSTLSSNVWGLDFSDAVTTVSGQSLGVHFKKFAGNSFYVRTGLDYRKIDYNYKNSPFSATEEMSFDGHSIAANFQIGNQWQWENFTLGCDWVGVTVPITSEVSEPRLNASAQSNASYYYSEYKRESDYYLKSMNINLLRFYLGASF